MVLGEANKTILQYPFPISFVVETCDEFRKYLALGDPFAISLIYGGIELLNGETPFTTAQKELRREPRIYDAEDLSRYFQKEQIEQFSKCVLPLEQNLNRTYNAVAVAIYRKLIEKRQKISSEELNEFGDKMKLRDALYKLQLKSIHEKYNRFIEKYYDARGNGPKTTIGDLNTLVQLAHEIIIECS